MPPPVPDLAMTRPPVIDNRSARRLFLARHGLLPLSDDSGRPSGLAGLIDSLGFVQVDSVNTLARAHDLILWSRRPAYRPQALRDLVDRDRAAFEHWTHDAAVIPVAFFPHWRLRFARDGARLAPRWRDWQGHDFTHRFDEVLRRIADDGPVTGADLAGDEARGTTGWWDWHPGKTALEFLWRTGHLAITRREGFRKVYDLTERVIPAAHLAWHPDPEETVDWACNAALDRLGFATTGELAAFWALVTPEEARAWCKREQAAGRIAEVAVEGADGRTRRALARLGTAEAAALLPAAPGRVRVLSPFDPALRDRARAERLFGFAYRIEIFVPEAQRRYGYYVFPVLEGESLIGRIDLKRDGETLALRAFWPEAGVAMGRGRMARLRAELERIAAFAGCTAITEAADWLRA